jgi:Tfp pilus assembly pilus retraction ATPase PilT
MRDLETVGAACTMAETGHLVFGTCIPLTPLRTINRIIDMFPPHQQSQIRHSCHSFCAQSSPSSCYRYQRQGGVVCNEF